MTLWLEANTIRAANRGSDSDIQAENVCNFGLSKETYVRCRIALHPHQISCISHPFNVDSPKEFTLIHLRSLRFLLLRKGGISLGQRISCFSLILFFLCLFLMLGPYLAIPLNGLSISLLVRRSIFLPQTQRFLYFLEVPGHFLPGFNRKKRSENNRVLHDVGIPHLMAPSRVPHFHTHPSKTHQNQPRRGKHQRRCDPKHDSSSTWGKLDPMVAASRKLRLGEMDSVELNNYYSKKRDDSFFAQVWRFTKTWQLNVVTLTHLLHIQTVVNPSAFATRSEKTQAFHPIP